MTAKSKSKLKNNRLQIRASSQDEDYLLKKCVEAGVDKSQFITFLIRKYAAHLAELLARKESPEIQ
jgi:hypothetical protein